jgi:hypothetical protein
MLRTINMQRLANAGKVRVSGEPGQYRKDDRLTQEWRSRNLGGRRKRIASVVAERTILAISRLVLI